MLIIETEIPVAVAAAAGPDPDPGSNLQFLRTLNLLALGTRADDPQSAESAHELARLEAKIDLLMTMVGALVAAQGALPPTRPVALSAESATVALETDLAPGSAVVVDLYLSRELPRPLRLPATVTEANRGAGGTTKLVVEFGPLDPALSDEFERYVFLQHRHSLSPKPPK